MADVRHAGTVQSQSVSRLCAKRLPYHCNCFAPGVLGAFFMPPESSDLSALVCLDLTNACLWRGPAACPCDPKRLPCCGVCWRTLGSWCPRRASPARRRLARDHCERRGADDLHPRATAGLGDDPRAPRFIETMHRRGYRFVGDLPVTAPASGSLPSAMHNVVPPVGRQEN